MASPDYLATAVLTEHFGFPPIAVIDDVINAVNVIMYKCTEAMEKYLADRQEKRTEQIRGMRRENDDDDGNGNGDDVLMQDRDVNSIVKEPFVTKDEIKIGTGKLETLLETEISKNFDKFELYCLRNLFSIPHELLELGMFRLSHHEGVNFTRHKGLEETGRADDEKIGALLKDIQQELTLRKILKLQIAKAEKLIGLLSKYKGVYSFLRSPSSSQSADVLKSLQPLEENLFYLIEQSDELIELVQKIQFKLTKTISEGGVKDIKFHLSQREKYLQGKSYKLLESIGVLEDNKDDERAIIMINTSSPSALPPSETVAKDLEAAQSISKNIQEQTLDDADDMVLSDDEILPSPTP